MTILIKDVPVGTRVKVYASGQTIINTDNGADGEVEATVVFQQPDHGITLLAWKSDKKPNCSCWKVPTDRAAFGKYPEYQAMYDTDYLYGWRVLNSLWVKQVLGTVSIGTTTLSMSGMRCSGRGCGVYNDYAQANTPEGLYYCYSCRQIPKCMR